MIITRKVLLYKYYIIILCDIYNNNKKKSLIKNYNKSRKENTIYIVYREK